MLKLFKAINWPFLLERVAMWIYLVLVVGLLIVAAFIPNFVR
jgi:hypothetical protein